ncbi:MAG: choline dehydrogenase [Legionella sp.]|nr:MAG: choline dehydrogenase [Legionella sp.]
MIKSQQVDYIIVGAGSAGCVLANRLSAQPEVQVALFEAGRNNNSWKVKMPAALTYNLENDKHNWFYFTEPQANMHHRKLYWPRGKILGGSSALNAMVYIRGHAKDFDRWHEEGATGWNYENVLPYFKRSETYSKGGNFYRGDSGPLKVAHRISDNPLFDAFIEAGVQAGYPKSLDINGAQQEGFGRFDMTIDQGQRCSAAQAYLTKPVRKRANFQCHTQAQVIRVLIEHHRAVGIEYIRKGKIYHCYATREVILAGGAINSPHLLLLSGIGPATTLQQQHIEVKVDLPGVGQNLQDHLEYYMQYECKKPITLHSVANPLKKMSVGLQWFLTGRGLAASSHLEAGAFISTRHDIEHPDLQYHFLPSIVADHGRSFGDCHAFQVHVGTLRPESRGFLELTSKDPSQALKIHANYLQTDNDLKDLVAGVAITREIFNQEAFKPYKGREIQPGLTCQTPKEMEEFIRAKADSAYHPCGTCKMGIDSLAVVNPKAQVYGIDQLRVVDASIMPSNLSGNLNASTIMMAERVSDLILAETH